MRKIKKKLCIPPYYSKKTLMYTKFYLNKLNRFLLNGQFPVWIYYTTFKTPDNPIWPIVHGLWCIFLVLASTKGIYCSVKSKFILTFIMSLFEERFLVFLSEARQLTDEQKIYGFVESFAIETAVLVIGWLILSFIPKKIVDKIVPIFGLVASFPIGVEKIRIFYFVVNFLIKLDPRLLNVVSISLAFGPEIVDILARKIMHNRSPSKYTSNKQLIIGVMIFVIAFQFLVDDSNLARMFGRPAPGLVMQFMNFTIPLYYLYVFISSK